MKYFGFSILVTFLVVVQSLKSAATNPITGNSITKFDYSAHARMPDLKRGERNTSLKKFFVLIF